MARVSILSGQLIFDGTVFNAYLGLDKMTWLVSRSIRTMLEAIDLLWDYVSNN